MNFNWVLKFPWKKTCIKKIISGYLKIFIATVNGTFLIINFSILLTGYWILIISFSRNYTYGSSYMNEFGSFQTSASPFAYVWNPVLPKYPRMSSTDLLSFRILGILSQGPISSVGVYITRWSGVYGLTFTGSPYRCPCVCVHVCVCVCVHVCVCLCVCACVCAQLLSCVLFSTPQTVAHQAPLSMGFSRGEWPQWVPVTSPDLCPYDIQPLVILPGHHSYPCVAWSH